MTLASTAGSIGTYRPCSACYRQALGLSQVSSLFSRTSSHNQRLQAVSRSLEACQQHDVLQIASTNGSIERVEVLQSWNAAEQSCTLLWKGQLLSLTSAPGQQSSTLQLQPLGGYPAADSLTVTTFPKLNEVLASMHQQAGPPPASIASAQVVDSLDSLLAEVQADAAFWRDGTAPGDPIKCDLQQSLFTAGELAALLAGQRGIALVQLWNGWDASKGQPLYTPCAITMLERVLAAPGVGYCSSLAPGGVGLTGIVYADREPFASWARHLASFGCQANTVAGSAYYKLLIGQMLGYKQENVLAYVASSGEPASAELQKQVSADIKKLSKVKPKLPWSASDTNVKKAKPAAKAGGKPAGFGAKR